MPNEDDPHWAAVTSRLLPPLTQLLFKPVEEVETNATRALCDVEAWTC